MLTQQALHCLSYFPSPVFRFDWSDISQCYYTLYYHILRRQKSQVPFLSDAARCLLTPLHEPLDHDHGGGGGWQKNMARSRVSTVITHTQRLKFGRKRLSRVLDISHHSQ